MTPFNIAQIAAIALLTLAAAVCWLSDHSKLGLGISLGFLIAWVPIAIGLAVGGR